MKNKLICVIPARGGSKRIPKKNIKNFNGKPIISYPIKTAIESNIFNKVIVSTDDSETARIALDFGAEVPFMRSSSNSNDSATTLEALKEVDLKLTEELNYSYNTMCCVYPCTPLISIDDLVGAYAAYLKAESDSLIPVIKYPHPIERALTTNLKGLLQMKNENFYKTRTQDINESYFDAGQFYFFSKKAVQTYDNPFKGTVSYYELDPNQSQDVDNENDWQMLELKFKIQNEIS